MSFCYKLEWQKAGLKKIFHTVYLELLFACTLEISLYESMFDD
jgi:hypothetical protein